MKKILLSATILAATFLSSSAHADWDNQDRNWNLTLGVTAGMVPEYIGSDDTEALVLPLIKGHYRLSENHHLFASTQKGVGYKFKHDNLAAGVKIHWRRGRDQSDDVVLNGLGDLDDTATVGGFLGYKLGPVRLGVNYMTGLDDDNDGAQGAVSAKYRFKASEKVKAFVGAYGTWGDEEFMDDHFTVTAAQANAQRSAFDADEGFYDYGLNFGANYMCSEKHVVGINGKVSQLFGDAEDSDLVEEETQLSAFISYGYRF